MIITNLAGTLVEYLTDVQAINRKRIVNGAHQLSFRTIKTPGNAAYDLIQEESKIDFLGQPYRIKKVNETSIGDYVIKSVEAHHTFFDTIDNHVYTLLSGSHNITTAANHALSGTGYSVSVIDTFTSDTFENFGDDNTLALFLKVMQRFGAEYEINGTIITLKKQIGNAIDYQFRYKHNLKVLNKDGNTNNLSTYIKGFGKQNEDGTYAATAEYTSPNSSVYGIRHAPPVYDERFTNSTNLLNYIKTKLQDQPNVMFTVDSTALGFNGGLGDSVYVIHEPMGVDINARIMEINEQLTVDGVILKSQVTISNFTNNASDIIADQGRTQKEYGNAFDDNGTIKYDRLAEAVKNATEALQSAQTELEFTNGIIARSKTDANDLVVLNSAGLGISTDGGANFKNAITADGIVASAGVVGQFAARNITVGAETGFESGYDPVSKLSKEEWDNIVIGGKNLHRHTDMKDLTKWQAWYAGSSITEFTGSDGVKGFKITNVDVVTNPRLAFGFVNEFDKFFPVVQGQKYTISFVFTCSANMTQFDLRTIRYHTSAAASTAVDIPTIQVANCKIYDAAEGSRIYKNTFTATQTAFIRMAPIGFGLGQTHVNGDFFTVRKLQVEAGEKATDWILNENDIVANANSYADGLKQLIDTDIQEVEGNLTDLSTYVDGTFEDGVISQAEAKSIEKYLNQINAEKADIDNRHTVITGASELAGTTEKTSLDSAKTAYNTAHTNLTTSINAAIADGKTTTTEKTDVDSKFTAYRTSLGTLSTAFENAVNKIAQIKVDNVQIGGKNLLKNSTWNLDNAEWEGTLAANYEALAPEADKPNSKILKITSSSTTSQKGSKPFPITAGETYTISFDLKIDALVNSTSQLFTLRAFADASIPNAEANSTWSMSLMRYNLVTVAGKFVRYKFTFTPTAGTVLRVIPYNAQVGAAAYFRELMVERGNKATDWEPNDNDIIAAANSYADGLKLLVDTDIQGVSQSVTDLNTFVNGSFKDGVITNAEAKAIAKYLNIVNADKSDVDNRFTTIYAITELSGTTERTALNTAKTNYNVAHSALITSINTAIADGATTTTEAADVDTKYTTYRTRIAELSTAFENAINKISAVKSANAITSVKTDLRVTAPLPTSINIGADGITANTPTTDKYARLDYRGLFINKGAIQVQRDDGFNLILDGKAQFDFGVDSADPPFMDSGVIIEGYWFRTSATSPVSCNYYTFKHTGRYLKIQIAFYKTGSGNTGGLQIAANGGGSLVGKSFTNGNTAQAAIVGEVFTVDLGIPTGALTSVYLRSYQDIANGNVYVRKIRAWLEG